MLILHLSGSLELVWDLSWIWVWPSYGSWEIEENAQDKFLFESEGLYEWIWAAKVE